MVEMTFSSPFFRASRTPASPFLPSRARAFSSMSQGATASAPRPRRKATSWRFRTPPEWTRSEVRRLRATPSASRFMRARFTAATARPTSIHTPPWKASRSERMRTSAPSSTAFTASSSRRFSPAKSPSSTVNWGTRVLVLKRARTSERVRVPKASARAWSSSRTMGRRSSSTSLRPARRAGGGGPGGCGWRSAPPPAPGQWRGWSPPPPSP